MVLRINPGSSARTKECSQLLSQLTSPACGFWVLINQRRLPAARGDRVPKREMLLGGWLGSQSQTSQHCEGSWLSTSSNSRGITRQKMGGLLERLNRVLGRVLERVVSSERQRKPKGPPMETIILCRHNQGSPRSIVKAYQDVHMRVCTHTHECTHACTCTQAPRMQTERVPHESKSSEVPGNRSRRATMDKFLLYSAFKPPESYLSAGCPSCLCFSCGLLISSLVISLVCVSFILGKVCPFSLAISIKPFQIPKILP